MADDDVQLTDLEVIQRYSLAVRGATASRADLVRALQADLDWLRGGRRAGTGSAPKAEPTDPSKAPTKAPVKPAKAAKKAAAKKAAAKAPAQRPAKG
jgi:hypothetical protein